MYRRFISSAIIAILLIAVAGGTIVSASTMADSPLPVPGAGSNGGTAGAGTAPPPVPAFSPNASSGVAPLAVRFTDHSTGPGINGWAWDFNSDGIIDSTAENPDCIFNLPGVYTVRLTVTGTSGSRTITRDGMITVSSPALFAAFTAENSTGIPPLLVQFRDRSTGPNITGWTWDFNSDGITDSTDRDPVCVYLRTGTYNVSLSVTNIYGSHTTTQQGAVSVTNGVIPAFSANQTGGTAPLAVQFWDHSAGSNITGRAWDFNNDGITDSTDPDPVCVYLLNGNYSVSMSVTSVYGSHSTTQQEAVRVTNGAIPAFTANQTTGTVPLAVRFHDLSSGAGITGRAWDFNNDGITDSTEENPVCVYLLPDRYTVSLTLTNAGGSNTTSLKNFIVADSLAPAPGFTANRTTGLMPLAIRFTDISSDANITDRAWDFNDDGITDSTDEDPVCVYRLPGNYSVRLRLTNEYGSNTTILRDFVSVSDGVPRARFVANRTSGPAPLAVRFRDSSTGPETTGRAWDFDGDGIADSTEKDVTNTYQQPGNYTIRFTVTTDRGSDTAVRNDFIRVT